jgi:hypothetical protein
LDAVSEKISLDFFAVSETSPEDRLAASADEGPVAVGEGVRVGRRRTKAGRRGGVQRGKEEGDAEAEREIERRMGAWTHVSARAWPTLGTTY